MRSIEEPRECSSFKPNCSKAPGLADLEPPAPYPVKGFSNHPNSCFMNSIVQLIINSPLVALLQHAERPIGLCLANIIHLYRHSTSPVLPLFPLKDTLNSLKQEGLYSSTQIYDAAEFFRNLGDLLDPELRSAFTGRRIINRACANCHCVSQSLEEFQSLTFGSDHMYEFPFKNRRCLHELLESKEWIEECKVCGEDANVCNDQILEFPRVLLLEFSRAEPNKKCHKYAFFEQQFQIKSANRLHRYRLSGVLYHKGLMSDGHYTSKVRATNGEFYLIDDEHVEETSLQNRSATATLLLYCEDTPQQVTL